MTTVIDSLLQISVQDELQSLTKKHEMQLSALKENLATVRTELKAANETVARVEQIKAEKAGQYIDSRIEDHLHVGMSFRR